MNEPVTISEAIAAKERTIEVPGSKLSEAMMAIRQQGGWCPSMDVHGSRYTLTVYWNEVKETQGELLK